MTLHIFARGCHNGARRKTVKTDVSNAPLMSQSLNQRLSDTLGTVGTLMAEYPGRFFGGAFFVGVLLGWVVKRR